ncbi:50S ribosomal protein L31 [candidate division WOR-1 bacterium RIFOXYB2_FULL_42_35]|uniref:Large ribosomal subunit protein bL31 n=1 Tax=candidate division WOR-1 bacterium RIFOXYC2_FULL_41_25 TaxID=1802586 RepID=A0A1F4TP52_UNCSA|nr:MAG: 50S ribosomal protein L31 [candidate division WOR-1 bacterium RIFOXYA2_FULL_41_14]OGC25094.1 MAG: 50S ribosomal protein L31 [candidate division WOR-1 bacterium RIFOXYB2_FULL_42_35]OGC34494.1 MAG: 50S ribosomal protein L31 [candidate division WOR-1 bacterium RIFOXYC2_FULL_41_25]OGC43234.1 MAG: 50S ribosomal protein L31 [candidate division WOR-1 bacterium RIFOXYD2_FULL_41_8]
MKEKIHPRYFETTATCACGKVFQVGSTKENLRVDICSACHPLFTGKEKMLDIEGRVQKFKKKYANVTPRKKAPVKKKKAPAGKKK